MNISSANIPTGAKVEIIPETIERVEDNELTPTYMMHRIEDLTIDYCDSEQIETIRELTPQQFNAFLTFLRVNIIPDKKMLKSKELYQIPGTNIKSNGNRYNYDLLDSILDIYILLAQKYNKPMSLVGYSCFTGIDINLLVTWSNSNGYKHQLSNKNKVIIEKLNRFREESLRNLSFTEKNQVAYIAAGNHLYNWGDAIPRPQEQEVEARTVEELPQLGGNLSLTDGQNGNK